MVYNRPLKPSEKFLLPRFLALAAHEEEIETVLDNPALVIYVTEWGRMGDCGVVAEDTEKGVVGVAWARFWTEHNRGFGWVNERTPEVAVAVEPEFRGQGIGATLIEMLKEQLRSALVMDEGGGLFSPNRVALNVWADSPAVQLYERLGFVRMEGSERQNRTGGVSFNMIALL